MRAPGFTCCGATNSVMPPAFGLVVAGSSLLLLGSADGDATGPGRSQPLPASLVGLYGGMYRLAGESACGPDASVLPPVRPPILAAATIARPTEAPTSSATATIATTARVSAR